MRKNIILILLVSLSFLPTACSTGTAADATETLEELQADYQAAILDAQTAEASEISTNLVAITANNPDLVWDGTPGESNVLVVTWTDWDGYAVGDWNMGNYNAWVSVAPEVQEFCQSYNGDDVLRLEQLLGMPPEHGNLYFVEFWVSPNDLFRPSPDPEITDTTAGLDFPADVSAEHEAWFNDLLANSYGADDYPWTRLGYTYDWGSTASEVGLSEFVIEKNADVIVDGIYGNEAYCNE